MPPLLHVLLAGPPTVADEPAPAPATCPRVALSADHSYPPPAALPVGDGRFQWPVGGPAGEGWYDLQPFGRNRHLGADLNADAGTRVGAPVTAVADGCVVVARDVWRGWGNVLRTLHRLPDGRVVEVLYAHLDHIDVAEGQWVRRGEPVGVVGDAHGVYGPHLHLELRTTPGLPLGPGYGLLPGYTDPMAFIAANGGER